MTQNMTPEQHRSVSTSPSKPLDGEIVELENEHVRIRLETGATGVLVGNANTRSESSFQLGQHGMFQILRCDDSGEPLLKLVSIQDMDASPAFEHDVDELQNALTDHHTPPIVRNDDFPALDEQRIQQWLNRVEKNLTELRRNRAKRLDEEFYSGS